MARKPIPLSETLRVALGVVMAAAGASGHRVIREEHALYALLAEPVSASVMQACGADLGALERDLQLHFAPCDLRDYRGQRWMPPMSSDVGWALRRARAFRRKAMLRDPEAAEVVTGADLLLALLEEDIGWGIPDVVRAAFDLFGFGGPSPVEVMSWHQITGRTVRDWMTRGAPDPRRALAHGTHRVLVHDDDRTTMDFVVGILESRFECRTLHAVRLMLQVHIDGCAVVGTFPADAAHQRVAAAMRDAHSAGYPLTLTVEPIAC